MIRYILRAEADKIQDFIFRSSRLWNVAGASQLLTKFCKTQTAALPEKDVIVADGGSFTLLFDSASEAQSFGDQLSQAYYTLTRATLTVAHPVAFDPELQPPKCDAENAQDHNAAISDADRLDFEARSRVASRKLAEAKRAGRRPRAVVHGPYMAFCASCGAGIASTYKSLRLAEQANYVCDACMEQSQARRNENQGFLFDFKYAVLGGRARQDGWDLPKTADDVGAWDSRNYVAYLVADGNSMGNVFRKCKSQEQLTGLSTGLTKIVRESLAVPTRKLVDIEQRIPVLPLILGGDDVFVLIPAPYALDFTREFCQQYEKLMGEKLKELGIKDVHPTMSAAVVVCKNNYPYLLAHRYGEELLKAAKKVSKTVALAEKDVCYPYTTVNFDVILGSRLAREGDEHAPYQPSLAPYWVTEQNLPGHVGLPLIKLLKQRFELRHFPKRRLAQLRTLYDPSQLPDKRVKTLGMWEAQLARILSRIGRSKTGKDLLDTALCELGMASGTWYPIKHPGPGGRNFEANGLADLLKMWDFSWELDRPRSIYTGQEG